MSSETSAASNTAPVGIRISIDEDRLTAAIDADSIGETPPVHADIIAALGAAHVAVDETVKKNVGALIEHYANGDPPSGAYVVAKGTPASNGRSETFVWDEKFQSAADDWQADAPINYYDVSSIVTVEKNETIGRLSAREPAREGVDVLGEPIPPTQSAERIELDKGVRRHNDDQATIVANFAGHVVLQENKVSIREVLLIPGDVDFATGSIDSTTDVHINGGIPDHFHVQSAGSISVKGVIEATRVTAHDDVVVGGGIVGRRSGHVHAGGNVVAKFCTEANITADGNAMIAKMVMQSRLAVAGKFIADHCAVIGGYVYAADGATTSVLGSDANAPTRVFIGQRPDQLAAQIERDLRTQEERKVAAKIRTTVQPLMDNLKRLTPQQRERATELMYKAEQADAHADEQERLGDEMNRSSQRSAQLRVATAIHPRVTISIGRRVVEFHTIMKGPVTIEERRIKNVTEIVAVNALTGSVKILKSQKMSLEQLQRDFESLLALRALDASSEAESPKDAPASS